MNAIKCTWCFNEVDEKNVQYRCRNIACKGKAVDTLYGQTHHVQPFEQGKVLYAPNPESSSNWLDLFRNIRTDNMGVQCPDCTKETHTQICPTCHHPLWRGALIYPQVILSVFGGPGTGKSCYIASLISILMAMGRKQGLTIHYLSDEDADESEELLEALPATTVAGARKIYTFRVTLSSTRVSYTVHLFDVSGEDVETEESIEEAVPQLFHSQGVIVMIDPLQMSRVRSELNRANQAAPVNLPAINRATMPDRVISRFLNLYEDRNKSDKPELPVVFTISKIDRLQTLIHTDPALKQSPLSIGYTSPDGANNPQSELRDAREMHEAAMHFLEKWDVKTSNSIHDKFQKYTCSGISALGSDPTGPDPFENAAAYRVTQPFFWILNELGLLSSSRSWFG